MKFFFINEKTGVLKHSFQILLYIEKFGKATSEDISGLLFCSQSYAAKMLWKSWKNSFLDRKSVRKKTKKIFEYFLKDKGEKICNLLHKKGF